MITLSPEQQQQLDTKFGEYFSRIIGIWRDQGFIKDLPDEIIMGLIDSLFYLHLHRDEVGRESFPEIMKRMVEMISREIVKET